MEGGWNRRPSRPFWRESGKSQGIGDRVPKMECAFPPYESLEQLFGATYGSVTGIGGLAVIQKRLGYPNAISCVCLSYGSPSSRNSNSSTNRLPAQSPLN